MLGNELLETLRSLPNKGPAAAILRHAERFPIVDPSDPTLAEITPDGAAAAESLGTRITGFDCVRLFHSPIKRCRQTAEGIARGAASAGLQVELAGPQATLGVDYIYDLVETGRLNGIHGEHFVRLWVEGRISPLVIRPTAQIAAEKLAHLTERLQEPCSQGRRLDLHVSHDWNVLILRDHMLGIRHEDTGWLTFLDGLVFSLDGASLRAAYRETSRTQSLPWQF